MRDLDPAGIVRVLNEHDVRFVVIGGIAALLHDLPLPATVDLDVTPSRESGNLERLAAAFEDLNVGLLTADEEGTWFPRVPVENWAQYDTLHLTTSFGPLDIVFAPDGAPNGYEDLVSDAVHGSVGEQSVLVISVPTWVALKEATGRSKDLEHLDRYHAEEPPLSR
ncbi:MAG: hypothetical protein ACNYZH_01230 [Acidimicrobiia bacterium]